MRSGQRDSPSPTPPPCLPGVRPQSYRVVAPYYVRGPDGVPTSKTAYYHFPPKNVANYTLEEAIILLEIFSRHRSGGEARPTDIDPYAVAVGPAGKAKACGLGELKKRVSVGRGRSE